MLLNRYKNNILPLIAIVLLFIVSIVLPQKAFGEQSKTYGDYEVHYVAYNSTFLSGDVAKVYGITRSKKLAVVVISVKHKNMPDAGVQASVKGGATNLMQQLRTLSFNEISEGKAIYYVSTFTFNHEENLTFKLDVTINQTGTTHKLKWQQQFWRD